MASSHAYIITKPQRMRCDPSNWFDFYARAQAKNQTKCPLNNYCWQTSESSTEKMKQSLLVTYENHLATKKMSFWILLVSEWEYVFYRLEKKNGFPEPTSSTSWFTTFRSPELLCYYILCEHCSGVHLDNFRYYVAHLHFIVIRMNFKYLHEISSHMCCTKKPTKRK